MNVVEGGFGKRDAVVEDIHAEDKARAVKYLEDGAQHAKDNGAVFALVIMVNADGAVIDGWSHVEVAMRPYVVVGALEALKADFMRQNIEAR